jgi:chemotaxis response regulator CheB
MSDIVRVLVVDDSAYVRKVVSEMLARNPFVQVVASRATAPRHWSARRICGPT